MERTGVLGIEVLLGAIVSEIKKTKDDSELYFDTDKGVFKMYHYQNCCESVYIEDICGQLEWLIGEPILKAEERRSHENIKPKEKICFDNTFTWTFYELATIKGSVTIRWYGESNGYYSENVSIRETSRSAMTRA